MEIVFRWLFLLCCDEFDFRIDKVRLVRRPCIMRSFRIINEFNINIVQNGIMLYIVKAIHKWYLVRYSLAPSLRNPQLNTLVVLSSNTTVCLPHVKNTLMLKSVMNVTMPATICHGRDVALLVRTRWRWGKHTARNLSMAMAPRIQAEVSRDK